MGSSQSNPDSGSDEDEKPRKDVDTLALKLDRVEQESRKTLCFEARDLHLVEVPARAFNLKTLKLLDLSYNRLVSVPFEVGLLANLRTLNLSNNTLLSLTDSIAGCAMLRTLNLNMNSLEVLPDEIAGLSRLTELLVADNRLVEITPQIGFLFSLQILDISSNRLVALPAEMGSIVSLKELHAKENKIEEIPESFTELGNLNKLDIRKNNISSLPQGLLRKTDLVYLYSEENPFHDELESTEGYLQVIHLVCSHKSSSMVEGYTEYGKKASGRRRLNTMSSKGGDDRLHRVVVAVTVNSPYRPFPAWPRNLDTLGSSRPI